jgi:hypothetical protein
LHTLKILHIITLTADEIEKTAKMSGVAANQAGNQAGNQVGNQASHKRVKFISIEPFYKSTLYQDAGNMYEVKVAKVAGVPKVGITRFWYSREANKFLPGQACFMTASAWFALTTQAPEITMQLNHMIKSMCHCVVT